MNKILKIDGDFNPCPVADGDELFPNGIFVFNITKLLDYIQNNPGSIALEEVVVKDFCKDYSSVDESHVDSVDISSPAVLAEISPELYNLIDGHHRMEKARRLRIISMPAYKLAVDQHMRFLTSEKAYVTFVEYWNSKIRELGKTKRRHRKGIADQCP